MNKVYLVYKSNNNKEQNLLSVHESKQSAYRSKHKYEDSYVGQLKASDMFDFYVVEKYVID